MDVKVCTLFSGSSANCTYVGIGGKGILIDAGGGVKKTEAALNEIGTSLRDIEAIFITHEHSDHILGLRTILKHYNIPVLANSRTLDAIERSIPEVDTDLFRGMPTGATAVKDSFQIISAKTSHDSAESVCYLIKTEKGNVGVITDLGEYNEDIMAAAGCCKAMILEANHDVDMLVNGSYPSILKKRVGGSFGHLSNDQSGKLLSTVCKSGVKSVILAHLSLENNTPALALDTVSAAVRSTGAIVGTAQGEGDLYISVAPRNTRSDLLIL